MLRTAVRRAFASAAQQASDTLQVCVVGSGPAGLYTAEKVRLRPERVWWCRCSSRTAAFAAHSWQARFPPHTSPVAQALWRQRASGCAGECVAVCVGWSRLDRWSN